MTLKPGDNSLPMTAIIDQASVLLAKDPKTGTVDFEIVGNSSVYNGQHLTYYVRTLAHAYKTSHTNDGTGERPEFQ